MAKIIEARVVQKAVTLAEWQASTLPIYDGEQLFIKSDVDDEVIGFKLGSNGKTFDELPYPDYSVRGKVNPSSVWTGAQSGVYIPTENGSYNGINVSLADGYQVLYWDGATLVKIVYDRIVDIINNLASTSTTAGLSANQGRILNEGKEDKSNKKQSITPSTDEYPSSQAVIDYTNGLTLGFEKVSNKSQSIDNSSTKYPSNAAVNSYAESKSNKSGLVDSSTVKYPSNNAVQKYVQSTIGQIIGINFGGLISDSYVFPLSPAPTWWFALPGTYNIPTLGEVVLTESLNIISINRSKQWNYNAIPLEFRQDFLFYDTVSDLRNMSLEDMSLISGGIVKGVELLGYYSKGDTPKSIKYYLSSTNREEDGGSVFEISYLKLEHDFKGTIDPIYFGAVLDGVNDNSDIFQKCIDYSSYSKYPIEIDGGDLFFDIQTDINKIQILNDGVKIKTKKGSRIVSNQVFIPLFVAGLSNDCCIDVDFLYTGQYDASKYAYANGVSGDTFMDVFDKTIYKDFLTNKKGVTFTGNYNPVKLTYSSYMAMILVRGCKNFDMGNTKITAMYNSPDRFVIWSHKFKPERPANTVIDSTTANVFTECENITGGYITLDGCIMGIQGGGIGCNIQTLHVKRFSDVQTAEGSFVGGYNYDGNANYWMAPPHPFYWNDKVDKAFIGEFIDEGIHVGISKVRPTNGSGYANSFKIKGNNIHIGTLTSLRQDGALDTIQGSKNITIGFLYSEYDSSIFNPGATFTSLRWPSEPDDSGVTDLGYIENFTISDGVIIDKNPKPTNFPISRMTKGNNIKINLKIYIKDFDSLICGFGVNGNNNDIEYTLNIENHTQTVGNVKVIDQSNSSSNIPIGRDNSKNNKFKINLVGWRSLQATNNFDSLKPRITLCTPSNTNRNYAEVIDVTNGITTIQENQIKKETWNREEVVNAVSGQSTILLGINVPAGWRILEASISVLSIFGTTGSPTKLALGTTTGSNNTPGNEYIDNIPFSVSTTIKDFNGLDISQNSNRAIRLNAIGGTFDGNGQAKVSFKITRTILGE